VDAHSLLYIIQLVTLSFDQEAYAAYVIHYCIEFTKARVLLVIYFFCCQKIIEKHRSQLTGYATTYWPELPQSPAEFPRTMHGVNSAIDLKI
jgi:hypothetical protein